jgi:hypothetical protein
MEVKGCRISTVSQWMDRISVLVVMMISERWLLSPVNDVQRANTLVSKTIPLDILRKFNSKLDGYSQGIGDRNNSKAGFNVAKAGGVSALVDHD